MGVGGQRHAKAALTPGNTRYPLYRRLSGSQSRSGQVWKISPPLGFDPRTVQPVVIRYDRLRYPGSLLISTGFHSTRASCPLLVSYIRQHQFYSITILTGLVTPCKLHEFTTNTSNNSHRWGILNVRRGPGP
jgi:hypothetical protein